MQVKAKNEKNSRNGNQDLQKVRFLKVFIFDEAIWGNFENCGKKWTKPIDIKSGFSYTIISSEPYCEWEP